MHTYLAKSISSGILLLAGAMLFSFCHTSQPVAGPVPNKSVPAKPGPKPRYEPMDTVRWAPAPNAKPPIGNPPGADTAPGVPYSGQTYRLAFLLPFLTNQADPESQTVPEKSRLALQFYGGANLALQKLATEEGLNLAVDVFDTQANDADLQLLFSNPRLDKAQVIIGPIRGSHVGLMAERIKKSRQILLSPESPTMDLTSQNPGFIQLNPSLRAHCAAIARHVRQQHKPEAVTLVCRQKEADRLPFFQQSSAHFTELVVPDAAAAFENIDLKPYLKPGQTAVFILPTWGSQDFVMAFFRKLKAVKGNTPVEVYGMPQWRNFENIEPEYFADLNVHISSAAYTDRSNPEVKAFEQAFYDAYGTVPDDDAFNGYDATLFTGRMLKKCGLSFPEKLAQESFQGLHQAYQFAKVFSTTPPSTDRLDQYDYLENTAVYILQYQNYKFVPADAP